MQTPDYSLKMRWLILLALVGPLLVLTPEPTDTVAAAAFQQGVLWTALSVHTQEKDQNAPPESWSVEQDAEDALRWVITRRPLDPQPWSQLGNLYAAWGRYDDALHAYGQAVYRGGNTADLDKSLAQIHAILGDFRKAQNYWNNYLARRPDDRFARLGLAWNAMRLADWERAHTELEKLLAFEPDDVIAHTWLGLLYIGPKPSVGAMHLQRAAENAEIASFLEPVFTAETLSIAVDDPAYRSALLGIAFLGLDISALDDLSEWGLDHRDPAIGEVQKAITTLALRSLLAAVYRNPAYADAYAYLGQALDLLGWADWAEISLRYALQLAPQSPVALTLMGLYWDRNESPEMARQYFEAAHNQDPDNPSLLMEISATYAAEGYYTAAEAWLLNAVETAPLDPRVWEMLAHFYLDYGIDAAESGLAAANRLLELNPDDARAHDLLGWALYLADEYEQAETNLIQALVLDPNLATAHFHLGRLEARLGRYVEASQEYHQAAELDIEKRLAAELKRAWSELPQAYQDNP